MMNRSYAALFEGRGWRYLHDGGVVDVGVISLVGPKALQHLQDGGAIYRVPGRLRAKRIYQLPGRFLKSLSPIQALLWMP